MADSKESENFKHRRKGLLIKCQKSSEGEQMASEKIDRSHLRFEMISCLLPERWGWDQTSRNGIVQKRDIGGGSVGWGDSSHLKKKNRFQIMGQLITMSQVGGQVLLSGPFNVPQLCLDRWRLQNHCARWLLR